MEAIEILNVWKMQDRKMDQALTAISFNHMFLQKSRGILTGIRGILKFECSVLLLILVLADSLFILVNIPFSLLRWGSFIIFNTLVLSNILRYLLTINKLRLIFTKNLVQSLHAIIIALNRFKSLNWLYRFPFVVVILCMFGIMQMQISLVPWFIGEFSIWWWQFRPILNRRFHRYVDELTLSRRVLTEV